MGTHVGPRPTPPTDHKRLSEMHPQERRMSGEQRFGGLARLDGGEWDAAHDRLEEAAEALAEGEPATLRAVIDGLRDNVARSIALIDGFRAERDQAQQALTGEHTSPRWILRDPTGHVGLAGLIFLWRQAKMCPHRLRRSEPCGVVDRRHEGEGHDGPDTWR